MKSVIQEGPSIAKAIEQGWIKAGKPREFSIKIYQEAKKNFLGMTKVVAKVGIFFNIQEPREFQQRQQKSPQQQYKHQHRPKQRYDYPQKRSHQYQNKPQQSQQQSQQNLHVRPNIQPQQPKPQQQVQQTNEPKKP